MKITFCHHTPLPVLKYGGTERILFWHMKELVRQGHEVVLIGHQQSKVEEYGINLIPLSDRELKENWDSYIPECDVLHLQYSTLAKYKVPTVHTVHGNAKVGEELNKNSVFVSKKHAEVHRSKSYVHNALDFNEYPAPDNLDKKGQKSLLFLAKASWKVKNLKDAKEIAIKAKKDLHIVGGKSFSFSKYIHNHGIIGGEKKLQIIRNSDALIFPVLWDEPFGIAMAEGMSQGLPVFGSSFGSLPEVIGPAGVKAKSKQELLEAVKNWDIKLSPKEIREYAIENFSIENYTKSYLNIYEKVINGESLSDKNPIRDSKKDPEDIYRF